MSATKVRVEKVTPTKAAHWLKKNTNNRAVNMQNVRRYAHDMRENKWPITGAAITFDAEGALLDGQNRLYACVEADTEFETVVMRGVEKYAQHVMDTGGKRGLNHALEIKGVKNSTAVAASCRWLHHMKKDGYLFGPSRYEGTIQTLIDMYENEFHGLEDIVAEWQKHSEPAPKSIVCGMMWVAVNTGDQEVLDIASSFFKGVHSGIDLQEKDPRLVLRTLLDNNRRSTSRGATRQKLSRDYVNGIIIKAFRSYYSGESIGILRLYNGERPNMNFLGFGPDSK